MKIYMSILALVLLSACAETIVKETKATEKAFVLPSLVNEKCGKSTFLYGIVRTFGDKNRIDGYFLETGSKGRVYLLNLKQDARLVGKTVVVSGLFHSININGLPSPNGGNNDPLQQSSLQDARILQVLEKHKGVDVKAINKECNKLKQEK